jgi:hypothetical protein
MKKIVGLFFVLASVFSIQAGTLGVFTTYGPLSWEKVDTAKNIYTAGGVDSILGADTQWLFKNVVYEPGHIYVLHTADSVGAADTIQMVYKLWETSGSRGTKVLLQAPSVFDTLIPQATVGTFYRWSALTVGNPYPCSYFDVGAHGWISAKIAKIRRASLWKAKFSK